MCFCTFQEFANSPVSNFVNISALSSVNQKNRSKSKLSFFKGSYQERRRFGVNEFYSTLKTCVSSQNMCSSKNINLLFVEWSA